MDDRNYESLFTRRRFYGSQSKFIADVSGRLWPTEPGFFFGAGERQAASPRHARSYAQRAEGWLGSAWHSGVMWRTPYPDALPFLERVVRCGSVTQPGRMPRINTSYLSARLRPIARPPERPRTSRTSSARRLRSQGERFGHDLLSRECCDRSPLGAEDWPA